MTDWELVPLGSDDKDVGKLLDYAHGLAPNPVYSGSVLPLTRYDDGTVGFDSNAGLLGAFKRGVTLPGDVLQGKVNPNSLEAVHRAADLTGMLTEGGAAVPAESGAIRTLLGPSARTIDKRALRLAKGAAELRGRNVQASSSPVLAPDSVRDATGWWQGPDGQWRSEISDDLAKLKNHKIGSDSKLSDYLDHPELFRAYPELHNVRLGAVGVVDRLDGVRGYFNPIGAPGTSFYPPKIAINPEMSPADQKSTLLHEIGHFIQDKEGWEPGANESIAVPNYDHEDVKKLIAARDSMKATIDSKGPDYLNTPEGDLAKRTIDYYNSDIDRAAKYYGYRSTYGETEARGIQTRMDMTPEQRAAKPFEKSLDVPESQRQYQGATPGWHNYPTYIPDPLERVLAGQTEPGWAEAARHDTSRARWMMETGALGEHYDEWKIANDAYSKARATGKDEAARYWENHLDDIHSQIGNDGISKLERSLDLPDAKRVQSWAGLERGLGLIKSQATSDVAGGMKHSKDLADLQGVPFSQLTGPQRDTLAKVEWALQHHGPEVLDPHAQSYMQENLPEKDYKNYFSAKYFSKLSTKPSPISPEQYERRVRDKIFENHQRLIGEAQQHYADRAGKHFDLQPVEEQK